MPKRNRPDSTSLRLSKLALDRLHEKAKQADLTLAQVVETLSFGDMSCLLRATAIRAQAEADEKRHRATNLAHLTKRFKADD